MVLKYFEGQNFGDAINPLIFNSLLPNFFDDDEETWFMGIGSTLGFIKGNAATRKIIVFSTGFAYDDAPVIDSTYDIRCVRGPLTAAALNIDPGLAVTDGAVLLRSLPEFKNPTGKKFRYSFIPHHKSEDMFDRWQIVFQELNINFISPREDPVKVIEHIRQSECVIAEAMHAAIIADCFRVPWIPVKMFEHINDFKWKDWLGSIEMKYNPKRIFRLYNTEWISWIINDKMKLRETGIPNKLVSLMYRSYQNYYLEKQFRNELKKIVDNTEPCLSNARVSEEKESQLLQKLHEIRKDYTSTR